MDPVIEPCALEEWSLAAKKIDTPAIRKTFRIWTNTHYSCQFMGKDTFLKTQPFALRARVKDLPVAWISGYLLSPQVLRLRGLYCLPEFRQQGIMKKLIAAIPSYAPIGVERILSFSTPNSLDFHRSCGFIPVDDFVPRPIELYDEDTSQYFIVPGSELVLMKKNI